MTVTRQSIAAAASGTTSAVAAYPASTADQDLLIAHVMSKPFGVFPTFSSMAPSASIASGSVANGIDVGSVMSTTALRILDGAITGSETVSVVGGTPTLAAISRWTVAAGKDWDIEMSQGADTTITGTAVSATGTNLIVVPGDTIVITVAITSDTITHTSQALAIAGATLSAITWDTVIVTTAGNDGAMYVGRCTVSTGSVTAAPVYTATSSLSGQSAASVTFVRLRERDPQLPGPPIGLHGDPMIEPESHSYNAPLIDGNGNIYRGGESNISHDTNRLLVCKSTDGGIQWKSVDWAAHPTAQDLECMWTWKVGTTAYFMITRDDTVWLVPFNLSDAASTPDTYGTQETVDSALSSTGVVQYCSFGVLSTGVMQMFYSDLLSGALNQIGYKRRTAVNTYTAKTTLNDGAIDVTGPACVVGAGDLTYLFYKDKTGGSLVYRTITSTGTISGKTTVATGASISTQSMPHTRPIYYDDAGTEVIGIAYINSTDILKYRELRNGVLQTEETISSAALTRNPGTTDSQAVVACLAVDGKDVHAMWSDATTGDLMRDTRVFGTGWGTDVNVWASGGQTGWYVYCDVVTTGGKVKLIYTYDQGFHVDDASNITYNEVVLRTLSTGDLPPVHMGRHG